MRKQVIIGALCMGALSLLLVPAGLVPLAAGAVLGYRCGLAAEQMGRVGDEDCGGAFMMVPRCIWATDGLILIRHQLRLMCGCPCR